MKSIIWAALAAVIFAGVACAADDAPSLLSTARLYPYAGVEQRWSFFPEAMDRDDVVWQAGVVYSLGAIAPSLNYRWNPEPGADINEISLGLRLNLRGLFK